ncbi:MAG: YbaK/EbsC family protein [Nitratireductor sp.]|nr:YbaK/EbsC family protein [Nitratireductor sp.]
MAGALPSSTERVRRALEASGLPLEIIEFPTSTRTAQEAADAIGCTVGQIVKSLVFRGETSGEAIMVLASGSNRVDLALLAQAAGEKPGKADADFVRAETGFAIGGVAPVGHVKGLRIFIDETLRAHPVLWAAAGKPNAVFRLTPGDLARLAGGTFIRVC